MARIVDITTKSKLLSFKYVAYNQQGAAVKGTIKASGEIEAERLLVAKGLNPAQVEAAPSMFSLEEALPSLFKIKPRDVSVFSRQLATLLKSGISLLPALTILQGQVATSRSFKRILESTVYDIRAGMSFSQALRKHPNAFSDIYCRTMAVGEQSGDLETVLKRMAEFQDKQSVMTQKVGHALTYPVMVLVVGIVVMVVLMTMVMPQLLGVFTSMNVQLPLPTRMLIAATAFFGKYKLYLLVAGSSFVALALWMAKQPTGRRLFDRLRLHAPVIGPPSLMWELARFTRTMSVLLGAGLKLQEIMEMIPQSTNNHYIRDALGRVNDGLLLGEGLAGPMSRIAIFPPLLIQMVAVGEESNTLDFTLSVVADFCESTADEKTSAMVGMIGPVSTIAIALLVGFIALAVIMPMYSLTGSFG